MKTCFKILQLKFDKKLTNRCIGLTLHISASTVFEVLARFKASSLSWPLPADISHDTLEKLIFRGLTLSGTKTHVKQRFLPLTPLLMVSDVLWSPVLPA